MRVVVDRCRRDLHTVLQWGVRSLDELHDVIDETMADELSCMVREKMLRILSEMADFEEAAEEFERTMAQGAAAASAGGQHSAPKKPKAPDPDDDKDDVIPERLTGESNDCISRYESQRMQSEMRGIKSVQIISPQNSDIFRCSVNLISNLCPDDLYNNLAIANRLRISCVHNTSQAHRDLEI